MALGHGSRVLVAAASHIHHDDVEVATHASGFRQYETRGDERASADRQHNSPMAGLKA
jgi:hypothetical protein